MSTRVKRQARLHSNAEARYPPVVPRYLAANRARFGGVVVHDVGHVGFDLHSWCRACCLLHGLQGAGRCRGRRCAGRQSGGGGVPFGAPVPSGASADSRVDAESGGGGAPLVGYYTGRDGELPGRWALGAMDVTGWFGDPRATHGVALCGGPGTGEQLGRRYRLGGTYVDRLGVVRRRRKFSAYDNGFVPHRSRSARRGFSPMGPPARRSRQRGISAWTPSWVSSKTRRWRLGVEVPSGATVARFDHFTSWAADPHIQAHLLVHNRVRCEDGVWRTLGRAAPLPARRGRFYGRGGGAASRVVPSSWWSWDRVGDNWHGELAGSPRRVIGKWSTRSLPIIGFGGLTVLVWWVGLGLVGWVFWVGLVAVAGLVGGGVPVLGF